MLSQIKFSFENNALKGPELDDLLTHKNNEVIDSYYLLLCILDSDVN